MTEELAASKRAGNTAITLQISWRRGRMLPQEPCQPEMRALPPLSRNQHMTLAATCATAPLPSGSFRGLRQPLCLNSVAPCVISLHAVIVE